VEARTRAGLSNPSWFCQLAVFLHEVIKRINLFRFLHQLSNRKSVLQDIG